MGKKVLIIGASGDIGYAIAKQLVGEGYQLLLHYYKNKEALVQLNEKSPDDRILAILQADLRSETDVNYFLSQLVYSVDTIIFASGTTYHGLFQDMTVDMMDAMLSMHVKSPWQITNHLLPSMIRKRAGKIIFITSIWGDIGASHEVIYSSVKGAQNSFVKALAKEVGQSGITVNAVSPGFIDTKMNHHMSASEKDAVIDEIPLNRAGLPDEVAHTVRFLLDNASSYIQGEIIRINGGW